MPRYYVRANGVGAIVLPMTQSLTMLNQRAGTISPVQLFSAMQRQQTQLAEDSGPPVAGQVAVGGTADVPGVAPAYVDAPSPPAYHSAPTTSTMVVDANAPGTIYMPLQIVGGEERSFWSDFWRFLGPPVVAATGLLVAVALLTRKRRKR